ncbi:unnamed protein product [Tuber aestivum]|uniref:SAM domain-containing protein n=1 Tax=Tuber aestivum TaxID=59557 RepID=A0A292PWI1_9PEZI|nr:unnamed protein product [Tuber aestivum]
MPPAHAPPLPPPPRPRKPKPKPKPKPRTKTPVPPPLTPVERAAAEAQLATRRLASQSRLKDAWESIFERYSQDFDGVADEIDTLTGEVVVDNGHLRSLRGGDDGGDGGGEGFDWEGIVNLKAGQEEEGEWIDEECSECKDRDELDDSFCRSCGGGGGRGGIFSTPLGASIVTPAKIPRSSPPEIAPLPHPLPRVRAADPKDWLVEDVSEWMCALIDFSRDEVVDLRKRVAGGGVTGEYLLGRLRFDDLKETLGITSFSKRMELWNEMLKLRGRGVASGGGITESSPCLPMPVPVVDSLEGDIDADTPTHTGRGKPPEKVVKGKKVMVIGLESPRMASVGTFDTPKQNWRGNGEGASPGSGSLGRTPDTISTAIAAATPTRSIKNQGNARKLPSPTTSIADTQRPAAKQQQRPTTERQESPDIISFSTPAPATAAVMKAPKQKLKPELKLNATTPSIPGVAKPPFPQGPPTSAMHLPLPPKPKPAPTTATAKNEAKKKGRSAPTTPNTTAKTTIPPIPASTIAKPKPFLTLAPPKRKRSSSTAGTAIGWTTDAKKRQRLSGRSFLKFGGGEDDDELSSDGRSPVERGGLSQRKGIIVGSESAGAVEAEKVHKCCGRGFCFGCLDLEGEEDDLV